MYLADDKRIMKAKKMLLTNQDTLISIHMSFSQQAVEYSQNHQDYLLF